MKVYAVLLVLAITSTSPLFAAEVPPIRADQPYSIEFSAQDARYVRLVIHASSGQQPCVDEMEVYGPDAKKNLALATAGAKATASSCYPANVSHAIEHLNDGLYGNRYSWIPSHQPPNPPCWAQIELPKSLKVAKVVISRDRERQYADRVPTDIEICLSSDGSKWKSVKRLKPKVEPTVTIRSAHVSVSFVPGPPRLPSFDVPGQKTSIVDNVVLHKDKLDLPNLALSKKAKAAVSSLIPGYDIHKIAHLNDGRSGNSHSWVAESNPAWAEIDLGDEYWVYRVAFGSDSSGRFLDRAPTRFKILTAREYNTDSTAPTWQTALEREGGLTVKRRTDFSFKPVRARWVRVAIAETNHDSARIDELEIFGQKDEIPLAKLEPAASPKEEISEQALMGEEHAWLKTYGRADLSPRLVPYNGRVKEYPRRAGNDSLPLTQLIGEPKLDGKLDDACWKTASRGVGRVVWPFDYATGPLIETAVWAGYSIKGSELFMAFETNRLLSGHLAIISDGIEGGLGVLALTNDGIVFRQYGADEKLKNELTLESGFNKTRTRCEVRLPLSLFPAWKEKGLLVRTGMGGKHTSNFGHAMAFRPSPLAMAESGLCRGGVFRVRFSLAADAKPITLSANPVSARPASPSLPAPPPAPLPAALTEGMTIEPGQTKEISIPVKPGPIGPECRLTVNATSNGQSAGSYTLNLFRYDPLQRTLTLFDEMIARSAAKGMDVSAERRRLAELVGIQKKLQTAEESDLAAERKAYREARVAKRRLFFRDADLKPIEKLLFVKRHAFEPSHNYSVNLDSRWRPGGAICSIEIPCIDGRFQPGKAKVNELFKTKNGIARTPMASFDAKQIYFGYRASKPEYYHIMRMNADGSEPEELTDGPFHDYWPCPLPDGGLAFITTRCKCRFLCWRPQAAVMFRMDADGRNMQPLSFANLSEWAPSVMADGRIIWTRSEYVDKGADFSHTLWTVRPDGTKPELIFGNTIIQPNGYANGRQVPGTKEICCTLISHFGDLNGPIALVDTEKGRFNQRAIQSITPEVPWPGSWPLEECFRDAVPLSTDLFLCSHSPRYQFGLYVIDRYGNREPLYFDDTYGCMCPTPLRAVTPPPVLRRIEGRIVEKGDTAGEMLARLQSKPSQPEPFTVVPDPSGRRDSKQCKTKLCETGTCESSPAEETLGVFAMADVYQGIDHIVPRGSVKYIRVTAEVRSPLEQLENGEYRQDHDPFMHFYAGPVDLVSGPYGWPSYVAKASLGLAPVEEDGSAHFMAPAGKQLYLQILDKDFNELQRMRSVVQLQPGEQRSCVGCHEDRRRAPPVRSGIALRRRPDHLEKPPWGTDPLDYQQVVQPVLTAKCVSCHGTKDNHGLDLTGMLDKNRVPASYRTLISQGWVHHFNYQYNAGGNEKAQPMTFGTLKSRLWEVLNNGHYEVELTIEEMRRIKVWIDLNCPLWPDYKFRENRPLVQAQAK
ncbi:MAG: discoidin domain-containing protein [Pirellulales bacterium]|nr:discoidin domain-containing protein [Pirellulales bacterium]